MPITQTMTFTATPPTTGETPTTFNYNAIACWNELKLNVVPDLNTAFTEMNALEENVNTKEASAVASAEAAVSAANFKGSWSSATSYTIGDSVIYLGITYRALLSGSNQNPTTATTYWSPLSIASSIKYTPTGEVSATTVQGAIDELSTEKLSVINIHASTEKTTPVDADELPLIDSASSFSLKKLTLANLKSAIGTFIGLTYAPIASPTFTGNPSAPTPSAGDNDTTIATTAFVKAKSELDSIGVGQTWQDVTASRALGTTYTNTIGKPKEFIVTLSGGGSGDVYLELIVGGVSLGVVASYGSSSGYGVTKSAIVPNGSTYSAVTVGGDILNKWVELI